MVDFAAYKDGFTLLELTRKYYREAGLDARALDLLIREVRHAAQPGGQPDAPIHGFYLSNIRAARRLP